MNTDFDSADQSELGALVESQLGARGFESAGMPGCFHVSVHARGIGNLGLSVDMFFHPDYRIEFIGGTFQVTSTGGYTDLSIVSPTWFTMQNATSAPSATLRNVSGTSTCNGGAPTFPTPDGWLRVRRQLTSSQVNGLAPGLTITDKKYFADFGNLSKIDIWDSGGSLAFTWEPTGPHCDSFVIEPDPIGDPGAYSYREVVYFDGAQYVGK